MRGQKARKLPFLRWTVSPLSDEKEKNNSLKMNDQCWNVVENKGLLWKTWGRSWNVYENKGT